METKTAIKVETTVQAPVEKVWQYWTLPRHITQWNAASDEWHSPHAENDLRTGGRFSSRMEAKDGSAGFDFSGVYDQVIANELIAYSLDDGRKVNIHFSGNGSQTHIVETFEADSSHSTEMQRSGWQSILDNFRRYVESNPSSQNSTSEMKNVQFSIDINAPREKVWEALWDDAHYRDWSSAFMEGSYYKTSDWKEGSKIHFLAPGGDGMYSKIDKLVPNEYISFRHIGMIKKGEEQPVDNEAKQWTGATENYRLRENGRQTKLVVDIDSFGAEWEQMLHDAFPGALKRVKEIAEA